LPAVGAGPIFESGIWEGAIIVIVCPDCGEAVAGRPVLHSCCESPRRDYAALLSRMEARLLELMARPHSGACACPSGAEFPALVGWGLLMVRRLRRELLGEPPGYRAQVSVIELANALGIRGG
jgi:hypothetical protein